MFDISWSELLILGIVTLVFVGPKELPVFLRTIGRYVGVVKRQASEFREQFDTAMREAELDQIRKDMMNVKSDVESSMRAAERSVGSEFDAMRTELDAAAAGKPAAPNASLDPDAHDADGLPLHKPGEPAAGAKSAADDPPPAAPAAQTAEAMKSGV